MNRQEIFQKTVEIATDIRGIETIVSEDFGVQNGFVDSVELMEFIITLEDTFNIEISDEVTSRFTTLGDIIDYIAQETNAAS